MAGNQATLKKGKALEREQDDFTIPIKNDMMSPEFFGFFNDDHLWVKPWLHIYHYLHLGLLATLLEILDI